MLIFIARLRPWRKENHFSVPPSPTLCAKTTCANCSSVDCRIHTLCLPTAKKRFFSSWLKASPTRKWQSLWISPPAPWKPIARASCKSLICTARQRSFYTRSGRKSSLKGLRVYPDFGCCVQSQLYFPEHGQGVIVEATSG